MRSFARRVIGLRSALIAVGHAGSRGLLVAGVAAISSAGLGIALGLEAGLASQARLMIRDWEGTGFLTSSTYFWKDESGRHRQRNSITAAQFAELVSVFRGRARFAAASMVWGGEVRGEEATRTDIIAAQPEYFALFRWQFEAGYGFSEEDERQKALVCVLGASVAKKLFPSGARPGLRVTVLGKVLTVRGILRAKGVDSHGEDRDAIVVVPYTTGTERLWSSEGVRSAYFLPEGGESVDDHLAEAVAAELRRIRGVKVGENQGFDILFPKGLVRRYRWLYRTHRLVALGIGMFSYVLAILVTGVVMRVQCGSRVREFGLKCAVGASRGRVVREIVAESALLAALGAVVGSVVALGVVLVVPQFYFLPGTRWSTLPLEVSWVGLAGAVMATVGAAALGASWAAGRFRQLEITQALRQ